jgi:hypothetical protein
VSAWLPVTIVAATQIAVQLILAIASIRRERAHARSNCDQIESAAKNGVVFYEIRAGGPTVMIIPNASGPEHVSEESAIPDGLQAQPRELHETLVP